MSETPTNPPISAIEKGFHYLALSGYLGLLVWAVLRLEPFLKAMPWPMAFAWVGWFVLGAALSLPFADLVTGLVHILLDDEKTKEIRILRKAADDFQRHHIHPQLLAQQPTHEILFQTVGNGYFYLAGFHVFFLPMHPFLCGFLLGCSLVGTFVQWIHQQAHRKEGFHLWLSPTYHHLHHTTFDRNFNIVAGGLGWLTDAIYPRIRPHGAWVELLVFATVACLPLAAAFGIWLSLRR